MIIIRRTDYLNEPEQDVKNSQIEEEVLALLITASEICIIFHIAGKLFYYPLKI